MTKRLDLFQPLFLDYDCIIMLQFKSKWHIYYLGKHFNSYTNISYLWI